MRGDEETGNHGGEGGAACGLKHLICIRMSSNYNVEKIERGQMSHSHSRDKKETRSFEGKGLSNQRG